MSEYEREPQLACAEYVWDGPYRMKCGYRIVNGECIRHGSGSATYEVNPYRSQA